MAITVWVSIRSCSGCLLAAALRAFETRSNSALTRGLICSAHSIWLGVPVSMAPGPIVRLPSCGEIMGVLRAGSSAYLPTGPSRERGDLPLLASFAFQFPAGEPLAPPAGLRRRSPPVPRHPAVLNI